MQYLGLAVVVALLSMITTLVAMRVLVGGQWLLGWLRGSFGMLVLALGVLIGVIAWDVSSYQPLPQEGPLASLSFQADGQQRYSVKIEVGQQARFVTLEGDLWQLDIRALHWKGLAALIGLEPGFRLEALSGRYLAVEQQDQARRSRVELGRSLAGIDFWAWLQSCGCGSLIVEAHPHRVSYLPIADDVAYTIEMTPTGLLVKPANAAAQQVLNDW